MKYKKLNKSAVSLMISYVLLISIVLALSVGVFSWLKIMANVNPSIDCKDDTSLVIIDYKCNPDPGEGEGYTTKAEKFNIKNLKLDLKNNGRFNIDGVIVTVSPTDSTPINYLAPDLQGGIINGHYYFSAPLEPQTEKTISFINQKHEGDNLEKINFNKINKIEIQPFIIIKGDKFERIICQNAIKRISLDDCTIIGPVVIPLDPDPDLCFGLPLITCEGNILKTNPHEVNSQCVYDEETCNFGCSNNACLPEPIAYWMLEDETDEKGLNNWEVRGGTTFLGQGISGNAAEFDGTNNHLKMVSSRAPNANLLEIGNNNEITLSAWIKTTSTNKQGIIKRGTNGGADSEQEYILYLETGKAYLVFSDGNTISDKIEGTSVNDGAWHLITGILRPNNQMEIYVDGSLKNTRTKRAINKPTFSLQTLGTIQTSEFFFTGSIDEVVIWNKALTSGQITALYQSYNP